MVPDTETSIGEIFWLIFTQNNFLHRDKDENIKCKAYFAEFEQSESVYFTKNKTSSRHVFIKQSGPNVT